MQTGLGKSRSSEHFILRSTNILYSSADWQRAWNISSFLCIMVRFDNILNANQS